MSSNLVIAAIPDENDRVWKVSSEKIPHLTVLFLGDADKVSNLEQIMLFVEHAANTTLRRFYLPVDRRGELGEDKADVLFFKKGRYDYKAIRDFRATLLQDPNIKTAYDSAQQFDGPWNPHLTLGYPDAPAKEIPDDQNWQFYDVQFNKIAVWTGDFEGPDFLLKDYWDEMEALDAVPMDVAMSDMKHHGVKGQKWGVRKVEGGGENAHIRINNKTGRAALSKNATAAILGPALIMPVLVPAAFLSKRVRAEVKAARAVNQGINAQNKVDKADKKFEKRAHSAQNFAAIHNGAQKQINSHIDEVNKKYPQDLTKDPVAKKKYDDEVVKGLQDAYRTSANQLGNKTGTRHLDVEFHNDGLDFKIVAKKGMQTPTVEHAAVDDSDIFTGKTKRNATGHIVGFEFDDFDQENTMAQADPVTEFMEHYGVRGMHWGVRKDRVTGGVKKAAKGVGKATAGAIRFVGDVKFESRILDGKARESVIQAANPQFRKTDLPAIKAKPEHQQAAKLKNRLRNPRDPGTKAYRKDVRETYIKRLETTANSMQNPSGTRQYTIRERGIDQPAQGGALPASKYYWDVSARNVAHAAEDDFTTLEVLLDDDGFVTEVKKVEKSLAQTADLGAEFLAHYGVRGMHWGVRKEPPAAVAPSASSVVPRGEKRKTKIKVEGGENHAAASDAIKVAQHRAKLAKSGTSALSNAELREVANRLQLEQQVKQLSTTGGKKFVSQLLKQQGQEESKRVLSKGVKKLAFA